MSDRDALMAAIAQNPDDDTPRLVFADWLDDHSDPDRARFIRLQCEAARLPRGAEKKQLEAAAEALLEWRRREWLAPLGPGFRRALFARGFVEDVTMTALAFLRHAGRVMSRTPLRKVAISEAGDHISGLAASPHLGRVAHLELRSGGIDSRAAQILAESPCLRQVESLDLKCNRIGAAGVRAVLDATAGGRTRRIEFGSNLLGSAGAAVLAAHPAVAGHTDLLLIENRIGPAGAEALAASPHLGRVTDCILELNRVGDRGVAALSESRSLRPEILDLSFGRITDDGVEVLAASRLLKRVLWLGLADNRVSDRGALALARSPRLRHLRTLSIAANRITDAGALALRDGLGNMDMLFMTDNRLSRRSAEELFLFPGMTGSLRGRGEDD